jgi:gliding motility-associated-like protein
MDVSVVMEVIVKACPCPNVSVISIPDQCNDDATPINLNNFLNANNMNPGSWSEVAGNPQTGLITNNMFTTLGTTAGTYQVQWTIATPVGACPTADTTSIVVFDAPNAAVSMNNLNLCNQDNNLGDFSVDLNTLLVNSDPGTWMQISGPTPLTGSLPTVNTEGLPVSSVLVYRYTTNNAMTPCTDDFVEVTINVIDCNCPFIVLGTDTLCNGDMTAFDLNSLITMNVTGQTGTWTTNAGAGVITGGNLFNPFGIASGQYTLTFTFDVDPGGSCQRIWNSTILIRRQPKATPKPSGMACNSSLSGGGPTVVLLNSLLETGYTAPGTWTQVDNGLPMLTIDATTSVDFDGSTIGDIFLFEYSVGANAPCTPITVTVSVVIIDCNCFEIGVLPPAPMCNSGGILDLTTLDDGSDSGDWSVTNDVGLPVTITNNILDVNGLDEGDYTITFTLNPAPPAACQKDSYVVLSISNQNFAIVTSTVSTCNNILDGNDNVVNFNDLVTMGGALNGTWENTDGAPVDLANPGLVVFDDPSIQIGDTYTFTFILPSDAPCVEQQYPVVVTIDCSNCDPVNPLTPQEHCTTESPLDLSIYDDPMRPGGDWTSTDITINNNLADLSGVANGVYVITYNVPDPQAPPCENSKDVMISIFNPVTTGTGEELRVCPGDTLVNLFDLLSGHDTGGVWVETSTSPSTGGAFNAGAGTFRTLNQVTGTFSFRYEFTNQDPCPDVSTSVTVVVENVPTADAGDEQFITCAVNQVTLNGSSSTGSNLVFMWTHQSGNPVNNANSPQITVNYGGTFTLTVTNSLTGCFSTDQVIVTVDPSIPQGVIASSDITCFGDNNGTITITNVSGGDGNFMYSIDGGVTFSSNTTFSDLGPGTYNVVVQDGQGCKIEQTEVIVQPVEVTVEAGPNQIIELGSNATISLGNQLDNLDVSVVWTAEDENGIRTICSTPDDCSEFSVTPAFDTQYCVTLTDANGCEDSDCLNIELRRVIDIVFPNIISPNNNDNTNETFYIESPSITFFKYLKIFDRWGSLVYSIEDVPSIPQSDGWNGTFNGKNVEQGVYAFIVSYIYTDANGNDAEETVAGDVTVVR